MPVNNFEQIPIFDSEPYDYGNAAAPSPTGSWPAPTGRGEPASAMGTTSGEELPLGLMVPRVPAGVEIPPEPPDVGARALAVATRLLAGATTFFFLAFLFAYFYLRSLNVDHMWRAHHVSPSGAPSEPR